MRNLPPSLRHIVHYYLFLVSVALLVATLVPMPWSVTEFGVFEPVDKRLVKAEIKGVISEIFVKGGQLVKEGEIIARVRDPQIELTEASNNLAFQKAEMSRQYVRAMYRRGFASRSEVQLADLETELEKIKRDQSQFCDVKCPVSGVFLTTDEIDLRKGDLLEPGSIIGAVSPTGAMKLKVRIREHNMAKIKIGDEVRIYVNAYPSAIYSTIRGTLTGIEPEAVSDSNGIFFVANVAIPESAHRQIRLSPGMAGYAKIVYERRSFIGHLIGNAFLMPGRA